MQLNVKNLTNLLLLIVLLFAWRFTASAINPQLQYFLQQSAFLTSISFFKSYARYPGGIADYISEFITQFFYFKTIGSLLILLTASLMGIIAIHLVQRIAGRIKLAFSIFTIFLLLFILVQCNYYYPFYASVRLLLAGVFIWLGTVLSKKYTHWRYPFIFLLALILFYMAGGAALFVYAISILLLQVHFYGKRTDWFILPLLAIFSALLPYVAYRYVFLVELPLMYELTHSKSPEILRYVPDYPLYALYAFLPLCILFAVLYNRFSIKHKDTPSPVKSNKVIPANKGIRKKDTKAVLVQEPFKIKKQGSPVIWLMAQLLITGVLAGLSISYSLDMTTRNKLLVSYYASNGDWDSVLKTAKSSGTYDVFTNVEYNRALANTGRLTGELFSYAQLAGPSGLFIDEKVTSDIPFICCDQYYDLGFMHEAQHWAFEAQTIFPNSPRLLKRLVQINLVNGEYQMAGKFLHQLNDNLLYRDWVNRYQKYLNDTSLIKKDEELSWKRQCEPTENFTASNAYLKLTKLLEANPSNKMACDYLLCSVLLDGDLVAFKSLLDKNTQLVHSPLPRVYDEALVLYYYMKRQGPAPGEISFTAERQKQFISFIKAIKPYGNDWQSARQSLAREFGNTYWYYLKCLSPKVTKAQIKRQ